METLLMIVGGLSLSFALGYLTYLMIVKIKFRNPIKQYIKKVVIEYLKELQND